MSFWEQTLGGVRKIVLLDDRVTRLEQDVDEVTSESRSHELRIQQLETIVLGPIPPQQLRLPRR